MRQLLLLSILALPCLCSAMSVDSYRNIKTNAESTSGGAAAAAMGINSYLSGVAETLTDQRSANGHIGFDGKPLVCIPPGVDISVNLLRMTIEAELSKNVDQYVKDLGVDWGKYSIAVIAKTGLSRMFPCPAAAAPVPAPAAAPVTAPTIAPVALPAPPPATRYRESPIR